MQEKLSYKGIWFLPGKGDEQFLGDLNFSPLNGAELQLTGVFGHSDEESHAPDLILGVTSDGEKITLYKCYRFGRSFNSNGFEMANYSAIYLLIGAHFYSARDLTFPRITCDWADFDTWLGIYGLKKVELKKDTKQSFVEYQQPESIPFDITDGIKGEFQFSTFHPSGKKTSKFTIEQRSEFSISFTEALPFETLLNRFQSMSRLLTLAYFGTPTINKLWLGYPTTQEGNDPYLKLIYLYFQTRADNNSNKKRDRDYSFLFTYNGIQSNFQQIVQCWYKLDTELDPVVAGLTEAFQNGDHAIEFRFLNLAHGIETFHRRLRRNEALDKILFKEKINDILNSVNSVHKNWLKEKLAFSNELSLQARLEELIAEIPTAIRSILFKPSETAFIKDFKNSRNYYTHYDKRLGKKALSGALLFTLTERLKIFLICLVLKEISFSEEEVTKTIMRKGVRLFNHIIKYDEAKTHFSDW